MPRDLPIGNGKLLIAFDGDYRVREIFYPHVGAENHTQGNAFRLGVWVDGAFAWMGPEWERSLCYEEDTLVTRVVARHAGLQIELRCADCVDFYEDILVRRIVVRNLAGKQREARLFFHHDFYISGNDVGDTAFYGPNERCVIHYKGQRYFWMNCDVGGRRGVDQFACGSKGHGKEGTWRDAEDGILGRNPIAQGAVDSTVGISMALQAGGEATAYYWMSVGPNFEEVRKLNSIVLDKGPAEIIRRTTNYWRLWANKEDFDFGGLPPSIVGAFKRSLLVVRTQIDSDGGIIAANDSDIMTFARDTYSYVWPRDGALVAYAMDKAGQRELSERFFKFCARVIRPEGYFLHKYNPDGSLASSWHPWVKDDKLQLPIQEDETALVLWSLWHHFYRHRNIEFVARLYRSLIVRAAEFMCEYRTAATGLPRPSYDLWEERQGILAFTTAAVHGGLMAAANFAEEFGEADRAARYRGVARDMRDGMDRHLWSDKHGRFLRMIVPREDGGFDEDPTIDASIYGVFAFGAYPADDARVVATMKAIKERLWVKTEVGGVARYENDYYHRISDDIAAVAGNPWFICTLWLAQHSIARARTVEELDEALPILEWVVAHALPSGVLAEQVHPHTHAPLSVSPLTWSHATVVMCVVEYLQARERLLRCPTCGQSTYRLDALRERVVSIARHQLPR